MILRHNFLEVVELHVVSCVVVLHLLEGFSQHVEGAHIHNLSKFERNILTLKPSVNQVDQETVSFFVVPAPLYFELGFKVEPFLEQKCSSSIPKNLPSKLFQVHQLFY